MRPLVLIGCALLAVLGCAQPTVTCSIAIPKAALDPKGGHIQGIAIGDGGAVYVSQMTQLTKLDRSGKVLATRKVINHTGDVTWWNGELYTAVAVQPDNKEGRIEVFDGDLNPVRSVTIDRAVDGIACLDGILYVGMGAKVQPSKSAHRVNILGRFDAKTLREIAPRQDFDYGYETNYGFQDIASDGKLLYATFYAVKGALRMAIFDKDGKVVGVADGGSNNGFDFLSDRSGILVNQNGKLIVGPLPAHSEDEVRVISPDGRNQIALKTDALAYEVRRDGVVVVAYTPIGMMVNGNRLEGRGKPSVVPASASGFLDTPVYKKSRIDLLANVRFIDWGDWGIRLTARNDGVAYRFEMKMSGSVRIDGEQAGVNIPDAHAQSLVYYTSSFGRESRVPEFAPASGIGHRGKERDFVYLPLTYSVGDTVVSISDADVRDYPVWYLKRDEDSSSLKLDSVFAFYPKILTNDSGVDRKNDARRERRWRVKETDTCLVCTSGSRTFPWRAFALADSYAKLCESDLIPALATSAAERDWSWVRPGKVAWDWWNAFDNIGDPQGCTTKTYERFVDFAAKNGIEYVIMDEGWSEKLDIWKFRKEVDVPHLVRYAAERQVGIILWMAWAQVEGDEERVAEEFARLGVRGFKVDFIDRGDAQVSSFLWKFSEECAKRRLLVDYHGIHRPTGLTRTFPNVLTFESVYGLEQMKWFENKIDMPYNDVAAFFGRQTVGPMDYTPGAMDNYPVGQYPEIKVRPARKDKIFVNPGSVGTRCHQMAMMVMYESPLQMLSDSPTKYEKNEECFSFMSKTPVVWKEIVGLGGSPDSFAACARRGDDDVWYVAALNGSKARTTVLDTAFLGTGEWMVESFADDGESSAEPTRYRHEFSKIKAGVSLTLTMSDGGGFVARLTNRKE